MGLGRWHANAPAFRDAAVSIDTGAGMLDEKRMPLCRSGELTALWRQGGLENVREQPIDVNLRFRSFADYWDAFLLRQGPAGVYAGTLDAGRLQVLRDEVKRRLSLPAKDAPFVLAARVWAMRSSVPRVARRAPG